MLSERQISGDAAEIALARSVISIRRAGDNSADPYRDPSAEHSCIVRNFADVTRCIYLT